MQGYNPIVMVTSKEEGGRILSITGRSYDGVEGGVAGVCVCVCVCVQVLGENEQLLLATNRFSSSPYVTKSWGRS